ncbi:hypothetical protein [Halalkalicoccus paucihalophilus]|nr:hypothetical protein [Halalkalicoccus paucihalophilus]
MTTDETARPSPRWGWVSGMETVDADRKRDLVLPAIEYVRIL